MNSLVFDIETAPLPDAAISPTLIAKLQDPDAPEDAWRERLGMYAPSLRVVAIVLLDLDTNRGTVLVDDTHGIPTQFQAPAGTDLLVEAHDEPGLLRRFWELAAGTDRVITYNGRRFDVPVLMQRSLIREVPVLVDFLPPRFHRQTNHLDLADVLSLFGATRPFGLAVWSEAIGEASPKEGEIAGADVGAAFEAGRIQAIAEYCARDVVATAQLARRVLAGWDPLLR